MNSNNLNFFKHDEYIIDQSEATYDYKIYDRNGEQIGRIKEIFTPFTKLLNSFSRLV